ncbi:MAG TPA: DNA primase [Planctomycetota bacterium]|nr:DNA primase [Planctomycetota bacterium]
MALIADETVLEVKRSVDIQEIVAGYIPLKRAGASYKGLCPFHEEKTPSFIVTPQRQTFKCFGCGKGGDAISFVMAKENVDYPEAIRILAAKVGITVKYKEGGKDGIGRDDLYRALEWAQGYFRGLLLKAPEAEVARVFFASRGVNDETSELFKLGYSMDSWDALLQRGRKAGFDDKVLAAAGLVIEREGRGGYYDRFRARPTFPIHDPQGRTIGFGARTLKKDDHPKFINSPETTVFSKGRGFYGLHLSKEEIEKTRTVYIVEGYLDVVVPFQAGVKGLVATLGTALTKDHLKILRRYADKVVLVFDSDAAGQKASERGLDLLLSENVDIFIAELPPGMDPDDVVVKEGPDRLRACLEKPREIFGFLMDTLARKHGTETPAAKARIVEDMLERLNQIPDPVKQEILVQQLAEKFGIEERSLRGKLARKREGDVEPAATPVPVATAAMKTPPVLEKAGRELLACAIADKALGARVRQEFPVERYPSEVLRRIATVAYGMIQQNGEINPGDLVALLQDATAMEVAADIVNIEMDAAKAEACAQGCMLTLGLAEAKSEYHGIRGRLNEASDEEQREKLRKFMETKGAKAKVNPKAMPGR